jgi:hypothetical protein
VVPFWWVVNDERVKRFWCRIFGCRWRHAELGRELGAGGYVIYAEVCGRCGRDNRPRPYLKKALRTPAR